MSNNINETANQAFAKYAITEEPQQTIHIEWETLAHIFTDLLREILGRGDIRAHSAREEYYDWNIPLEPAISEVELEFIFDLVDASDWDRDASGHGDGFPVTELCEGLCKKVMKKLLPFDLISTRADDEGVWFIGKTKNQNEGKDRHA
jgi:hypothetical protein